MPTLITRGTAAARAFGLTGSSSGQLYTQVFTSNGTFTPPPGMTNVVTLVGQGGDSIGDYMAAFPSDYAYTYLYKSSGSPGGTPLPLSYATVATTITDIVNTCNAGGIQTIYHDYGGGGYEYYTVWADNTYTFTNSTKFPFTAFMYPYSWGVEAAGGLPVPPSGSIANYTFSPEGYYHAVGLYQAAGSDGPNSTALGQTFPGATLTGTYPTRTGGPATPATYNNIAVTPGTAYPIVVGAGGSVSISYIIP